MPYTAYASEKKAAGITILREKQFKVATRDTNESIPMLIWLGKQYAGQREPTEKQQAEFTTEQVALIKSIFSQIAELQKANTKPQESPTPAAPQSK